MRRKTLDLPVVFEDPLLLESSRLPLDQVRTASIAIMPWLARKGRKLKPCKHGVYT